MWSDQRGQTRNLLLAFRATLKRKTKRIMAQSTRSTQSALYGTVIPVQYIYIYIYIIYLFIYFLFTYFIYFFVLALCSNETTAMERGTHCVGHEDAVSQSGGEGPVPERDHGGHRGPTAILPVRMRVLSLHRCSNGLRWACSRVSKVISHTSNALQPLNKSKCVHFKFQ
jgi:hypothetical protein